MPPKSPCVASVPTVTVGAIFVASEVQAAPLDCRARDTFREAQIVRFWTMTARLAALALLVALGSSLVPGVGEGATNPGRNPGCEADASHWIGYHGALTRAT